MIGTTREIADALETVVDDDSSADIVMAAIERLRHLDQYTTGLTGYAHYGDVYVDDLDRYFAMVNEGSCPMEDTDDE